MSMDILAHFLLMISTADEASFPFTKIVWSETMGGPANKRLFSEEMNWYACITIIKEMVMSNNIVQT
jgi:hypothetical protein